MTRDAPAGEVVGMTETRVRSRLSDRLTSRRGAWISLGLGVLLMVALFGIFGSAEAPSRTGQAPAASEASAVTELMDQFPDSDVQPVLVVAARDDGGDLTSADLTALEGLIPVLDEQASDDVSGPAVSDDGKAAVLITPITVGADNTETAEVVKALRADIADSAPDGLTLQVTGGPAFGADVASAFDGADFTLLLVTILIVAILLIITYRSPVLWLIPLIVIAVADGLAGRVTAAAGSAWGFGFDAGIISVLVFGAGANYALLLISRYREELQNTDDDRRALSVAWRKSVPAILASNVTVVLALITLIFATIPHDARPRDPRGDRPRDRASRGTVRAAPVPRGVRTPRVLAVRAAPRTDPPAPQRVALDRLARVEAPGRQPRGRRRAARRDGHRPVRHVGRARSGREVPGAVRIGDRSRDALRPLPARRGAADLHHRRQRGRRGGREGLRRGRGRRARPPGRRH